MTARNRISVLLCSGLAWIAGLASASAGGTRIPIGDPSQSTSYVEIESVFSSAPPTGFAPVRITVRNDTEQSLSFNLGGRASQDGWRQANTTASQNPFTAPKEQTSYHTLLVPMCNIHQDGSRSYGGTDYSLRVDLTGATSGSHHVSGLSGALEMAAFTKALTTDQVGKFNNDTSSTSSSGRPREFAVQFEHTYLPADWRAFSGLDFVSFSTNEWLQLTASVRASILQWVELGGTLSLYTNAKETPEQLQLRLATQPNVSGAGVSKSQHGFGVVRIFPWDQKMLRTDHLREHYSGGPSGVAVPKTNSTEASKADFWNKLQKQFGERSFNAWQVGIILILFGLLVGPVNLFYFAKAGQRHRLFFTTPIISLGASLLLIAFILFQDGTGGTGVQTSLVYVNPASSSVSIHQTQLSRTGVLFSGSFTTDEPANILPVTLPDSRWTRIKSGYDSAAQNYTQADAKSFGGDWFQSRSEQAQIVEMSRSSRGRIELTSAADQPPMLKSSLAYPVEVIFYTDGEGKLWSSNGPLATGGTVTLRADENNSFADNVANYSLKGHPLLKQVVQPSLPRNHFFAFTRDPKAEFISTLTSIAWAQRQSFVWGPISTTAVTPP